MANYNSLTRNEQGRATYPVATAANFAIGTRVKLNTNGALLACGVTEYGFAVIDTPPSSSVPPLVGVRYVNAPGDQFGVASAQINVGDLLYAAANGQVGVSNAANAVVVGRAKTAAAAANIAVVYIAGTTF